MGWQAVRGLASFMALCGLGALANVAVARDLYDLTGMWLLAGFGGAAKWFNEVTADEYAGKKR